jgi:hypothetical protein
VPPNVFVRDLKTGERRAMTNYQDPAPQLKGVQKQLVTYKRNDGVELSATLSRRQAGRRRRVRCRRSSGPTRASSPIRQWRPGHRLVRSLHLDQRRLAPALPDPGLRHHRRPDDADRRTGETANDTYIEQLVASAQAAVDRAVRWA